MDMAYLGLGLEILLNTGDKKVKSVDINFEGFA